MKPHLPVNIFHTIISVITAAVPLSFASLNIPDNYSVLSVYMADDISCTYQDSKDYAFVIQNDLTLSACKVMSTSAGKRLFTSASLSNLTSLTFNSDCFVNVEQNESLTLKKLNSLAFNANYNHGTYSANFQGGAIDLKGNGELNIQENRTVSFTNNYVEADYTSYTSSGGAIGSTSGNIKLNNNEDIIFKNNYILTNYAVQGGAIYNNNGLIELKDNDYILFQENYVYGTASSRGGAICSLNGDIFLENNQNLNFIKNSAFTIYRNNIASASGGAIYCGGTAHISKNENVFFIQNSVLSHSPSANSYGGAIRGNIILRENKSVYFCNNYASSYITSSSYDACGGAIFAKTIDIIENDKVFFEENYTYSLISDTAKGGAIYAYTINIRNNKDIIFTGNYEYTGYGLSASPHMYRLRSLYVTTDYYTSSSCNLSAATHNKIEFRDTIYCYGTLNLNENYFNSNNELIEQNGDIIFTGAYVAETLLKLKPNYTDIELENSLTSTINSFITLYGGRLQVVDGAKLNGRGLTVKANSNATLLLRNGHMSHDGNFTFENSSGISLQGINIIDAEQLIFNGNNVISVQIGEEHLTESALTLTATLDIQGALSINIDVNNKSLSDGNSYKLLNVSNYNSEQWTSDNVLIHGIGGTHITFDDLEWKDNTLYLNLKNEMLITALTEATWINATGDRLWNSYSLNWLQDNEFYAYRDNIKIVFGDEGAGTLTLTDSLSPKSVVVYNNKNHDYEWRGDGELTGVMNLIKQGDGALVIHTNNSFTGGSIINGGRLEIGSDTALGVGDITLNDGVLNINGHALTNNIHATGGILTGGEAYNGKLAVSGNLVIEGTTSAKAGIELNSGSISGGRIEGTDLKVNCKGNTAISSSIKGSSTLTINGGNVLLTGTNNYTGGTILNDGYLTIDNGNALGIGDISINGGTLNLNDQNVSNNINLHNGNLVGINNHNGNLSLSGEKVTIEGGYTLSTGKVLEIEVGGTNFGSDLTLDGGTLRFKGSSLTVNGEVTFTEGTTTLVDLHSWEGPLLDGVTLAFLGTEVHGWSDGCLNLLGMNNMSLLYNADTGSLTLKIENEQPIIEVPTITWQGAKNTVWQQGKAGWMNATTGYDAVYENGAEVIFTQSGAVTIAGAVAPGTIIVAGDKAITFKSDKANPGRIVGETSLIKRGNGQLTLNDGNSYTGGTFIEAGTVSAGGDASFGSGAISISGGTLDLKGKSVLNDITLTGAATIKNGKTFGGELILDGELLKGSTLNIAENAEVKSGLINGTLSGVGTLTVSGVATLGTTGKITTNGLEIDGSLTVSAKGLSMNTKASAITVTEGGTLISDGAIKAFSMEINGGTVDIEPIKASSVTLSDSLHLNNVAMMNFNGKLSAKGSITIEGDSKLILNGALSAKNLTLGSGDIYMTSTKLQTIKVSNELTLNGGTELNFGFSVTQADVDKNKVFKILTFKVLNDNIEAADLYSLLGLSEDICTLNFDKSRKSITLIVEDYEEWNKQAEAVRNGELATAVAEAEDMLFASATTAGAIAPELKNAADTLVQSTWGTVGASRAFGDTIANRGANATLLDGGKGVAWISTMGGSSRISSESGHAGADYTLTGAAFGIEANISADSTLGISIGNSWGKVGTFSAYPVDQDSTHTGIYGNHKLGDTLSLCWMATHTRTESDVNLAGLPCTWSQDALLLDARLTWAKALTARTTVNAFGGLQYLATDRGECDSVKTGSIQNLRAEIGVGATHRFTGDTMAYGELSFIGDVVRNNPTANIGNIRTHGTNPGRAGMNLSVGVSHRINADWSVNATYNLELMQNITSHGLNIGSTYCF